LEKRAERLRENTFKGRPDSIRFLTVAEEKTSRIEPAARLLPGDDLRREETFMRMLRDPRLHREGSVPLPFPATA